jgi:RNA polymerase-binding transcription factor DksA
MDLNHQQHVLEQELTTLMARAHRIDDHQHERDREVPKDWDELAQYRQGDEVVNALDEATRAQLTLVQAALSRLELGEYGMCLRCGKAIDERRLLALPATPVCIGCAEGASED